MLAKVLWSIFAFSPLAAPFNQDEAWTLLWTEAKISRALVMEVGALAPLQLAREVRRRFGVHVFICEPGERTFRQHDGPNPIFDGVNALVEDQSTLEQYCESFRSEETQEISGLFIRANSVFQPNENLPLLSRNYPIILTWTVALRESLIHEFIHYLIEASPDRLELFHFCEEENTKTWKSYEQKMRQLERLQKTSADSAKIKQIEKEIAALYFPELIRFNGEEVDVYRFMVENAQILRLSEEDIEASQVGFYLRLQYISSYVIDYLIPLVNGDRELRNSIESFLPKLKGSLEWAAQQDSELLRTLGQYKEKLEKIN